MEYVPYNIEQPSIDRILAPEYRQFLATNVLASGVRLLLRRRERAGDYPFPNLKFNPNTGQDYPNSQYETLFTWFLGRGGEACSRHLRILDSLDELSDVREEARKMLAGYVRSQNEAILGILEANKGRIPFRVNRRLQGIDASGNQVSLPPDGCSAAEIFCAKSLMASGKPEDAKVGVRLFRRFVDAAFANGYEDDTATYGRELHSESPFMLSFAAFEHLVGGSQTGEELSEWNELASRILDYVLDNFWEPDNARFFERIEFSTKNKQPVFIPGHASELVGLGLQAIRVLERAASSRREAAPPAPPAVAAFARAKHELPRILFTSYATGYDHVHGGMRESINPLSGDPINSDLPWWCLPEVMRAAASVLGVTDAPEIRRKSLEILSKASNDYFAHYPNPQMHLFPFRTRSGETGEVKNLMPVVPEADPLYHTNLAIIDMLSVFERLKA